ncbi:hypothetical protein BKA69DRAFT_1067514 [Paraphysoderma sedebokerense]|nr:hypothetical protein BKA69DRAFT_1067514 [Paraphysoderma sedebokerense]
MSRSFTLLLFLSWLCHLSFGQSAILNCINVQTSKHCNAFMSSPHRVPINMEPLIQNWFQFPQNWTTFFGESGSAIIDKDNDFDLIFDRYILKHEAKKYKVDYPNANCDLSQEPIRYYRSHACANIFMLGENYCANSTGLSTLDVCANTSKTHYQDLRQSIGFKPNTCNQTLLPILEDRIKSVNARDSNCVSGDVNEPGLCGYASKEFACGKNCTAPGLDCAEFSTRPGPTETQQSDNPGLHPAIIAAVAIGIAGCIAFSIFIYRREQRNKEETMNPSYIAVLSFSRHITKHDIPTSAPSKSPDVHSFALDSSTPSTYEHRHAYFSNNINDVRPVSSLLASSPISLQTIFAQSQLHSQRSSIDQCMHYQSAIPAQNQEYASQPGLTFHNNSESTASVTGLHSPFHNHTTAQPEIYTTQSYPISDPYKVLNGQSNWP